MVRWSLVFALVSVASAQAAEPIDYDRQIRPILSDACFKCHGFDAAKREADLRLDTFDGATAEHDGRQAVVPNKPEASELLRRVTSSDPDERMPPADSGVAALTPAQVELLRGWIAGGATYRAHWSFVAPQRPSPPAVKNPAWVRNPLDAFVLARLEQEGLSPSPEAGREMLLRRVTLDLTGLPPTPAEVDAFLFDNSAEAYERVVDRLLASPRYGERMAWDWLDAARYADTNGYQGDPERTMWPWRDWVVQAFNQNMPYDQFTIQQLAGDLLPEATLDQRVATGFLRNHMHNGEGGRIAEETRVENVFDRVETMATVWLGVTVGCARCHDHKYDPFTNREYYQLYAYFNNSSEAGGIRGGQIAPVVEVTNPEEQQRLKSIKQRRDELAKSIDETEKLRRASTASDETSVPAEPPPPLPEKAAAVLKNSARKRTAVDLKELIDALKAQSSKDAALKDQHAEYVKALETLKQAIEADDAAGKAVVRVMVMDDMDKPRDTFMLKRGAYDKPGELVSTGLPASLPPLTDEGPNNRLTLARWLVAPQHPLTARVTANRFWQTFFGAGLVKTVDDFGAQGEKPSHPELLDWLATELVRLDWDVKALVRLMVTSATYRQSSKPLPGLLERDPENRWLARGSRYRLPSWMIRDQALSAAGLLVEQQSGKSVRPYQPEGVWEEATFGKISYRQDHGSDLYRRSLYIFWRRIVGPTMFFDNAARQTCTVKTVRTNTPLHALITLNDITYVEAARALAQRAMLETAEPEPRIVAAFRLATARRPTAPESSILKSAYDRLRKQYADDPAAAQKLLKVGESPRNEQLDAVDHAALTALCSLILNLDETLSKQ